MARSAPLAWGDAPVCHLHQLPERRPDPDAGRDCAAPRDSAAPKRL